MNKSTNSPEKPGEATPKGAPGSSGRVPFLRKLFDISDGSYWDMISGAGTIGLHMVACTVVGYGIGYGIDYYFETGRTYSMVFFILGVIAGFQNMYRENKRLQRKFYGKDDTIHSTVSGERNEGELREEKPGKSEQDEPEGGSGKGENGK